MEILNKDPEEPYFAEVLNLMSSGYTFRRFIHLKHGI